MNVYYTTSSETSGLYKEKGSKFLSFAYPVESEDQVRDILLELRKTYHDARHHCYAYIIGLKEQSYRANDDGEPNHSAGDPILGQIRSKNLTNCLVVVVRYFGGTKLGVGGLIAAYKAAAEDALVKAKIRKTYSKTSFKIWFNYDATSDVERILSEFKIDYTSKEFTEICEYRGMIVDEELEPLTNKLQLVEGASIEQID